MNQFPKKIIVFLLSVTILFVKSSSSGKVLSRAKRYLVFPEGATLSIAICMTAQMGITPGEIFTEGMNWGLSYELPNTTHPFKHKTTGDMAMSSEQIKRRHRRDLYGKVEAILNALGYEGRSCILRTLCEATSSFGPSGQTSLIDKLLNILFSFPQDKIDLGEPHVHKIYQRAALQGTLSGNRDYCREIFPCPFSLIDLALGYYSGQ